MSGGAMSGGAMSGGAMSGGAMSGGAMSGGAMSGGAMRGVVGLALLLGGCSNAASISGLVAGGAAGGATANPAVGYAVGLGVKVVAKATLRYAGRVRQHAEQDAIAAVAGPLAEGGNAPWQIQHDIPFGNEAGQVVVVRAVPNPLADCREIAFSVHDDPPAPESWFTSTICKQARGWTWALAEPAVERWGYLQNQ